MRPSTVRTRSASPAQAAAGSTPGAAAAVVGDADPQQAGDVHRLEGSVPGAAVLGHVGEQLGGGEVGDGLDGGRRPLRDVGDQLDRDARCARRGWRARRRGRCRAPAGGCRGPACAARRSPPGAAVGGLDQFRARATRATAAPRCRAASFSRPGPASWRPPPAAPGPSCRSRSIGRSRAAESSDHGRGPLSSRTLSGVLLAEFDPGQQPTRPAAPGRASRSRGEQQDPRSRSSAGNLRPAQASVAVSHACAAVEEGPGRSGHGPPGRVACGQPAAWTLARTSAWRSRRSRADASPAGISPSQ